MDLKNKSSDRCRYDVPSGLPRLLVLSEMKRQLPNHLVRLVMRDDCVEADPVFAKWVVEVETIRTMRN